MDLDTTLLTLKELSDPRAIKVWARLNMPVESYLGVGLTKLRALAKKIRRDHDLALALWDTGIHDARLLATMIADPKRITKEDVLRHAADFDFWDLSDNYCRSIIAATPLRRAFIMEWMDAKDEYLQRSAYILLAAHARADTEEKDSWFDKHVTRIEKTVQKQRNWVKEGMILALIAIGARNPILRERVLAAAEKTGRIDVDYGQSSCTAPDVVTALTSSRPPRGSC